MHGDRSSKPYEMDLDDVCSKVMQIGGVVASMLPIAVGCFRCDDRTYAARAIKAQLTVWRLNRQLDEACRQFIMNGRATADDLSAVTRILKVGCTLERIGNDLAKLARNAVNFHEFGTDGILDYYNPLHVLADTATQSLRRALDSFARQDVQQATQIAVHDTCIAHAYDSIVRSMLVLMMEDPRTISAALECMRAAKAIERIGDGTKTIAKYAIFIAGAVNDMNGKQCESQLAGGCRPCTDFSPTPCLALKHRRGALTDRILQLPAA